MVDMTDKIISDSVSHKGFCNQGQACNEQNDSRAWISLIVSFYIQQGRRFKFDA